MLADSCMGSTAVSMLRSGRRARMKSAAGYSVSNTGNSFTGRAYVAARSAGRPEVWRMGRMPSRPSDFFIIASLVVPVALIVGAFEILVLRWYYAGVMLETVPIVFFVVLALLRLRREREATARVGAGGAMVASRDLFVAAGARHGDNVLVTTDGEAGRRAEHLMALQDRLRAQIQDRVVVRAAAAVPFPDSPYFDNTLRLPTPLFERLHEDDVGTLWRVSFEARFRFWPITLIEVRNSTPNEDGSTDRYFLRVRDNVTTAREAVASTFGLRAEEYKPQVES